jgi:hypothetical protein
MPYHYWGDEDFDWNALYSAEKEIRNICMKYARVCILSKEKYGTIRWEHFGVCDDTLHSLTHPGYMYSQYPKWLWSLDLKIRPLKFVYPIIRFWQSLVIQYAFTITCLKYPHIQNEILSDCPREVLPVDLAIKASTGWCNSCTHCNKLSSIIEYVCPNCGKEKR